MRDLFFKFLWPSQNIRISKSRRAEGGKGEIANRKCPTVSLRLWEKKQKKYDHHKHLKCSRRWQCTQLAVRLMVCVYRQKGYALGIGNPFFFSSASLREPKYQGNLLKVIDNKTDRDLEGCTLCLRLFSSH